MENVWDYPRPPAVEVCSRRVRVELAGVVLGESDRALRVLETSHPPTYYLPVADVLDGVLRPIDGRTVCEFKGVASYWDVVSGDRTVPAGAWTYPQPRAGYEMLLDHLALYPGRMDRCTVDGETVRPQEGGFYGGWITDAVVGPFKGSPGSWGW